MNVKQSNQSEQVCSVTTFISHWGIVCMVLQNEFLPVGKMTHSIWDINGDHFF